LAVDVALQLDHAAMFSSVGGRPAIARGYPIAMAP